MPDREKIISDFEKLVERLFHRYKIAYKGDAEDYYEDFLIADAALELLKKQEALKQKMWNALYAEEDKLEKKFVGTDKHNDWFTVYRPFLQRGFEIAIEVIVAHEEGR